MKNLFIIREGVIIINNIDIYDNKTVVYIPKGLFWNIKVYNKMHKKIKDIIEKDRRNIINFG